MNTRTAIQTELNELNSSLPIEKQPVFTVPEGYFEGFAASVLAKIRGQHSMNTGDELSELSPMLAAISKKMPYSVPENYFSNLSADVPAIVGDEALPTFLATHSKQMPYEVPAGYFENLPGAVLAKVAKPQAKVVSMGSRWMRYAAAAVVTGLIAVSGILYFKGDQTVDPSQQPEEWVAKKLKGVSNQALEEFINTTDYQSSGDELVQSKNGLDVGNMLDDVSTRELDAFLDQVPTDNDELSVIN